ncbi:hypothetical protein H0H92_008498, partial [Tricholoma furcatifolium]
MSLAQFNANPSRSHLVAAKGVLRYLLGTVDLTLEYNFESPQGHSPVVKGFLPTGCGFADADWASDQTSRRS